jgi:epsilon-lactone hydrolase
MSSLRSRILYQTLNRVTSALDRQWTVQEQRTKMDQLARRGIRLPRGVNVRTVMAGGIHSEWIEPAGSNVQATILYLHGGGYCICSLDTHRGLAARLAQASQARVLMIEYRLAPEHPFPAALEDALAAYRWLLGEGIQTRHLVIAGDSAGGGLSLATAVSLRDAGLHLPAALVCISPWTDLTFSGESVRTKAGIDPVLKPHFDSGYAHNYTGDHPATHPLISPLFADLHGLPATLIHVGDDEILLNDSTRLEEKMKAAGVEVALEVWEGMWHVFQVFAPYVPEADMSIQKIGQFIKEKAG